MIEFELVVSNGGCYWEKNGQVISRVFPTELEAWSWFEVVKNNYAPNGKIRTEHQYEIKRNQIILEG